MSHFVFTLLLAAVVSAGLSERFDRGVQLFARCLVFVVAGGWTMFLIHG